jgi:competence protein ComEC
MKTKFELLCLLLLCVLQAGCFAPQSGVADFQRLWAFEGEPEKGDLVLTFFRVDLGDAIMIEFPSGKTLLVDTGLGTRVGHILNYCQARSIKSLDGLMGTHPHMDHIGAVEEILEALPTAKYLHNGLTNEAGFFVDAMAAVWDRKIPQQILRRGDSLNDLAGPGVDVEVIYPDERGISLRNDLNCASIVLRIEHGKIRILLTGDCEHLEEKRLH